MTVFIASWAWVFLTIGGSVAQVARNAMQRDLIERVGTAGATNARFIFGLPFTLLSLLAAHYLFGYAFAAPTASGFAWLVFGALAQVAGTGLMLLAMKSRSFVVATAYIKTEPLHVALFALVFLGERPSWGVGLGIIVATAGVLILSWPEGGLRAAGRAGWRPAAIGILAGGVFALAAVGYRAAVLTVPGPVVMAAITVAAIALAIQTAVLTTWMGLFQRQALVALMTAWRTSLTAGFMSSLGTQFLLGAFALSTVARVRTLALIEVLFAQVVSRRIFKQGVSRRELLGMATIVAGLAIVLNG